MPGALDKALADRERQMRQYRIAKRAQYLELYADPMFGEWFRKFVATLNHFGIEDAGRMLAYVKSEIREWLGAASENMRIAALEMIGARVMRIRERAGLPVISDPLPGQPDDMFRVCKRALGL